MAANTVEANKPMISGKPCSPPGGEGGLRDSPMLSPMVVVAESAAVVVTAADVSLVDDCVVSSVSSTRLVPSSATFLACSTRIRNCSSTSIRLSGPNRPVGSTWLRICHVCSFCWVSRSKCPLGSIPSMSACSLHTSTPRSPRWRSLVKVARTIPARPLTCPCLFVLTTFQVIPRFHVPFACPPHTMVRALGSTWVSLSPPPHTHTHGSVHAHRRSPTRTHTCS
mmetsp:Transcript_7206/g.44835  ORF Transcript_7206/g.44835 Transcript_7206/m.44835 type:complete len:224 (-) Transcript_7206:75-746(-)